MVLTIVAVIFGVFAIGLVVLLIYKSTLLMHRDDQLFLDDASSHMHAEQTELLTKVNRLTIPMRVLSIGSGVFLMVLAAMWFYQKLNANSGWSFTRDGIGTNLRSMAFNDSLDLREFENGLPVLYACRCCPDARAGRGFPNTR
jgi:hypothetical protein